MKLSWDGSDTILELVCYYIFKQMSVIIFLIIMQWIGMKNTHWTNQISQETDKYYSDNYSINFIKESNVAIVLHKEVFESCEYDSNPATEPNCI